MLSQFVVCKHGPFPWCCFFSIVCHGREGWSTYEEVEFRVGRSVSIPIQVADVQLTKSNYLKWSAEIKVGNIGSMGWWENYIYQ